MKKSDKFFNRRLIFFLSAFISVLFCTCVNETPKLRYINAVRQLDYPSGSTSVFLNHEFYIMGDDASEILIFDRFLNSARRVGIFPKSNSKRIPKVIKADIEASLIVENDKGRSILFLGSGSLTAHRDSAFLLDPGSKHIKRLDYSKFYNQLKANFSQLNIEGAANIGGDFYLGIRANYSHPNNYIVIASGEIASPGLKRTILLKTPIKHIGLSGMDYDEQLDVLFITFSTEDTSNSVTDGEIGDSYLALITNAKSVLQENQFIINEVFNLSNLNDVFMGQKIESVSFDSEQSELLLVSDDDKGNTKLFKLAVNL